MKTATIHPVIPQTQKDTIVKRNYERNEKHNKTHRDYECGILKIEKAKPRKLSIKAQLEKPIAKQTQKTEEAARVISNSCPPGAAAAREHTRLTWSTPRAYAPRCLLRLNAVNRKHYDDDDEGKDINILRCLQKS